MSEKRKQQFQHIEQVDETEARPKSERPPGDWFAIDPLSKQLGCGAPTIAKIVDEFRESREGVWIKKFRKSGQLTDYLHPDLIEIISHRIKNERKKRPPEGWKTLSMMFKEFGSPTFSNVTAGKYVKTELEAHPEWESRFYLDSRWKTYYHPDLVKIILKKMDEQREVPEGWLPASKICSLYGSDFQTIVNIARPYYEKNPGWATKRIWGEDKEKTYYHPELVKIIVDELQTRKQENVPEGWKTCGAVAVELGVYGTKVQELADRYREKNKQWFRRYRTDRMQSYEHFHPDLVAQIVTDLKNERKEKESNKPPEGWRTRAAVARLAGVDTGTVRKYSKELRRQHPEWVKTYYDATSNTEREHYNPELIERVTKLLEDVISSDKKNKKLVESLENNLVDVRNKQEGSNFFNRFRSLASVFGSSRCLDILYALRPEYKGLPVEYVKGVIADYLGDYLVAKGEFHLRDVAVAAEHLSNLSLREGLYETIKDNCLRYFYTQRQNDPAVSGEQVIYGYLDEVVEQLHTMGVRSTEVDDVLQEVIVYYDSVLKDFRKPEGFVDKLKPGREFPDINQRINMKELADKKRLLIADEMGLGKSASVIMAKEQLGVKCALIVAPSNVTSTWERYLSDNPEQGGYYRPGQAPRVLMVESPEALQGVTAADYDYIIISHERMNETYNEALSKLDYDMMIVDEVHKVKSLKGVRAEYVTRLAGKIEGDNKYLAMLSGTPVPNKIKDVAIILKLLYPDRFAQVDDRQLVGQIIHGDIMDLRSLLVPHMQMKSVEEALELPRLEENNIDLVLSRTEQDVYDVLLEDDEVDAREKMNVLRKFLLNPRLLDSTPNIESTKVKAVGEELREAFKTYDRIVMFVNNFVEDVIRGEEQILEQLGLPEEVEIRVIHGENKSERQAIQDEFQSRPSKKILLVVSGDTADVGVDYSAGERVYIYNDPWTEYVKRQQVARIRRPGLEQPLNCSTFVVQNTIEAGIQKYIQKKYQAVEKLLRGIPISELEKAMIERDERQQDPSLEVNRELAERYFSSWERMMQFYGYVKEIGEEKFEDFLRTWGELYAEAYVNLGNRSYQANANRVCGTIIHEFARERGLAPTDLRILDIASGPEMLKSHIGDAYQERVVSIDINKEHFKQGEGKRVVGSIKRLPFANGSFNYANMSLSWHYTNFAPSQDKLERIEVLTEANRVLKPGGRLILNIMYNLELKDMDKFRQAVGHLGFQIVEDYTNEVESNGSYRSTVITLEKTRDIVSEGVGAEEVTKQIAEAIGRENAEGFKFRKKDGSLKDSRRVVSTFYINGRLIEANLNQKDQATLEEERQVLGETERLKATYGSVADIPREEVINRNFVRILVGKKYVLFKKLVNGNGVVVVR